LSDRGFRYAHGVFDTLVVGQDVDAHFARLKRHAKALHIDVKMNVKDFHKAMQGLVDKNHSNNKVLNTYITCDSAVRGLALCSANSQIIMALSPMPPQMDFKAIVAQGVRRNEFSPLSQIKSMCYGDNILALREVTEKGANEAILLNTKGNIACASIGNIIVEIDGARYTPPLKDGAIDGITRAKEIAAGRLREKTIKPQDLKHVYICNSVRGIVKIEMV